MDTHRRILVTGFQPFLGEVVNPSALLLDWLKVDFKDDVETILLPVSFQEAPKILQKQLIDQEYDLILLLGQAGGRSKVNLERVALNWIETEYPDEDGYLPQQGMIFSDESMALLTSLPLSDWKNQLVQQGLPVEISLSAGGYVCNYLYYSALRMQQRRGVTLNVCFIHVPFLPEQVLNKPQSPSMDLAQMKSVLDRILRDYLKKQGPF